VELELTTPRMLSESVTNKLPQPVIIVILMMMMMIMILIQELFFCSPTCAVVRAAAKRSNDLYVAGSNPTLGRGCRSVGWDRINRCPLSQ
jgi:hypothetical protein